MEFKDEGISLSQEINLDDPKTLGWLLASNLVNQDGTIELFSTGGTTCKIVFG
jgi:two-component sensor histidine kinase